MRYSKRDVVAVKMGDSMYILNTLSNITTFDIMGVDDELTLRDLLKSGKESKQLWKKLSFNLLKDVSVKVTTRKALRLGVIEEEDLELFRLYLKGEI